MWNMYNSPQVEKCTKWSFGHTLCNKITLYVPITCAPTTCVQVLHDIQYTIVIVNSKLLALESSNLYRNLYLASLKPKSIDILCQNLSTAAEHLDPQNVPVKALVGSNN